LTITMNRIFVLLSVCGPGNRACTQLYCHVEPSLAKSTSAQFFRHYIVKPVCSRPFSRVRPRRHYHALAAWARPEKSLCSKIPSDALAILFVSPAVMPLEIFFFAQDLTVDQPRDRNEINQADPIWKYQKFANQDHRKRDIDGIAAKGENAIHDELVRMIGVDADSEALLERNHAPQQNEEAREAEQYSRPCESLGMEKLTCANVRPIERSGEQDIEIKEGKRWNQEIRLVDVPELHRFDPLPFQQKDPSQNYSQQ
jgi:hypothetical protein